MPNHVHVLFEVGTVPMAKVVQSWKRFTANRANALLGRKGSFWREDYWDTFGSARGMPIPQPIRRAGEGEVGCWLLVR
jgi:hypothetical protein